MDKKHSLATCSNSLLTSNSKPENNNGLELVLIIDRSGSMDGKEKEIANGYNRLIRNSKLQNKNVFLTTLLFDHSIMTVCDGDRIENAQKVRYYNGGFTALYDAVGCAIDYVNLRKDNGNNRFQNANVIYVIVTDGYENSSSHFSQQEIQDKVQYERMRVDKGRREFILLGDMSINVELLAKDINVDRNKTQIFIGSVNQGLRVLFQAIDMAINDLQIKGQVLDTWQSRTDNLAVGNYTLKKIKSLTKNFRALLEAYVLTVSNLEAIASQEGLSYKFLAELSKCRNKYNALIKESKKLKRVGVIDDIISGYLGQNKDYLNNIKSLAGQCELDKRLNATEIILGKGRLTTFEDTEKGFDNLAIAEKCFSWICDEDEKDPRVNEQSTKLHAINFALGKSTHDIKNENNVFYQASNLDAYDSNWRDKSLDQELLTTLNVQTSESILKQEQIDKTVAETTKEIV